MTITIISKEEQEQLYDVFPQDILEESDVCIAALQGDEVHGILTAKAIFEQTWDVTFIHVDRLWRGHHVGEDMLRLLVMTVRQLGAAALTASFFKENGKDELYEFAVMNGFETVSESGVLGTSLSSVSIALDSLKKVKDFGGDVLSLDEATDTQWKQLNTILEEKRSEQDKKRGKDSGLLYIMPEPKNYYKTDISCIAIDKKDVPCGALLMREADDYISVDYLVNLIVKKPDVVICMMKTVVDAMSKKYKDIDIHFHTYNPEAEKLARTLLGRYVKDEGKAVYMIKYL